jgi:hypothetical protein
MDANQRRLLIALKSPVQQRLDTRHRCEDCGSVLSRNDFQSYWDGCPELERTGAVPRICEECNDAAEMVD